ncbi:MAG: hypothetical protein SFU53_05840 [Terrimicrobiaceae bacterium]|nr:hypothetical protein [Terrimicrobiaceae bacterium]
MKEPSPTNKAVGAALVIVLALIVLLTILVSTFFFRVSRQQMIAETSAEQAIAEELARGAGAAIIGNLRQEIAAGSTIAVDFGKAVFMPLRFNNAHPTTVPQRTGLGSTTVVNGLPNLLKKSASGVALFSGPGYTGAASDLAVSSVSTSAPSLNGRAISLDRWQLPRLFIPGDADLFTAPAWALITRKSFGSSGTDLEKLRDPSLTNPDRAIGRFAFVVYDQGGILDINTAGSSSAIRADQRYSGHRGRLAQADLTALPGLTQPDVDAITAWRDAALPTTAAYEDYLFKWIPTQGGLTKTFPGNQRFIARQELLAFFDATFGENSPQHAALPFLGTFSRELNGPTHSPQVNAAAPYRYADNADLTTAVNRNFPNVRFQYPGQLGDGREVAAGDPLVRKRFSLTRLQVLADKAADPSNTSADSDIKRWFGLTFDSNRSVWVYTSPDATVAQDRIKTLGEVAQANPPRELDFFELLQAGILAGSLGKSGGRDPVESSGGNNVAFSNSNTYDFDEREDFQIIQIAANIIDQSDADDEVTVIQFGGTAPAGQPEFYDFYGTENLPYVLRVYDTVYRRSRADGRNPNNGQPYNHPWIAAWLQFELWNPHANPRSDRRLRVFARGPARFFVFNKWFSPNTFTNRVDSPVHQFGERDSLIVPVAPAGADAFREPRVLIPSMGIQATGDPDNHLRESNRFGSWNFVGLKMPDLFVPDRKVEYYPNWKSWSGVDEEPFFHSRYFVQGAPYFDIIVQYEDGNGNWRTYQRIKNFGVISTNRPSEGSNRSEAGLLPGHSEQQKQANAGITFEHEKQIYDAASTAAVLSGYRGLVDPRTDRFGLFFGGLGAAFAANGFSLGPAPPFNTSPAPAGIDDRVPGLMGGRWPGGQVMQDSPATGWAGKRVYWGSYAYTGVYAGGLAKNQRNVSTYWYNDRDGVNRRGDAALAGTADQDANGFQDGNPFQMGGAASDRPERPVILNRPFRSVGELSATFRGQPWKSLDFFTAESADAGLLDLFSLDDGEVVAGRLSLNTRHTEVIQAVIQNVSRRELVHDPISPAAAAAVADDFLAAGSLGNTPYVSKSAIVTQFLANRSSQMSDTTYPINKHRREAVVRALGEIGNARTWNLLIDLVVQSGRYTPASRTIQDFMVEGQRRYWLHVAIDRWTGEVIESQWEAVDE